MGCVTTNIANKWEMPPKPKTTNVNFVKYNNAFIITEGDAKILCDSVNEMKAYEFKMELLINEMAKTYNAKLEVYSGK